MFAMLNQDIVLFTTTVSGQGLVSIPDSLLSVSSDRLGFDGQNVVDLAAYTEFYIDGEGTKHVQNLGGWQLLACRYDDVLVRAEGVWRVHGEDDEVADAKAEAFAEIKAFATQCRAVLVEGLDQYRMAEYSDKAAMAPRLIAGTASEDEQAAALGDPWAVENEIKDAAAVGAEWQRKAVWLRQTRNRVNQMERDALQGVDRRRTAHTVREELAAWGVSAKDLLAELQASQ